MSFLEGVGRSVVLFDGAMGTEIQKLDIQDSEWGGYPGCNEILSVSSPEKIAGIYRGYLEAGADLIETNTFGAQKETLEEHGLAERTVELNRESARLARKVVREFCSTPDGEGGENGKAGTRDCRYVVGSMGPGTKLPSLGHIDFDTLYHSYYAQAKGLIEGGVDAYIVETSQDPLQIKAAVLAIRDAEKEAGVRFPVVVSITVETNGAMLVGTDIAAAVTILEPLDIDVLGVNCATGPAEMRPHIKELASLYRGPVFCMPNAGFPEHRDGKLVYDLPPENFADHLISFVQEYGVDVIGGCCGTDPSYIAELRRRLEEVEKPERRAHAPAALAGLYSRQELRQDPGPFFVGERTNTNGSKKFRENLLAENWHALEEMGKAQQKRGAHGIDVSVAYAGRDERRDMRELISRLQKSLDRPLVIDSTDPDVIEAALKLTGGRALINSVNLENGPAGARSIFALAARYGAAIIALTIDEKGMARSLERKIEVARRLVDLGSREFGLRKEDIVIDPLTFTLGSGEQSLREAGFTTLEALGRLKKELPGIHTILGVSNISYGLSKGSREVLNSVFLHEAVGAGLDLAIVNVRKIIPLHSISDDDKRAALDLIYHRGGDDPLLTFITHFEQTAGRNRGSEKEEDSENFASLTPQEQVRTLVVDGISHRLEETLDTLRKEKAPEKIISEVLIPSMKEVGDLFGEGEIQLPFVLQSAEVMKKAVDYLQPFMSKTDSSHKVKVVLATVRGDVHDIGKNLVDIILSNNGYEVHNLGIKVDIDEIIDKSKEIGADAVGMSGLLVKSTAVMRENIEIMKSRGIDIPVLLGGAALTRKFVEKECNPLISNPVYYCRDAFDGLHALSKIESPGTNTTESLSAGEGEEKDTTSYSEASKKAHEKSKEKETGEETIGEKEIRTVSEKPLTLNKESVPAPSVWGPQREEEEEIDLLFSSLNTKRLIRGRWGYKTAFDKGQSQAPGDVSHTPVGISEDQADSILKNLRVKIEQEQLLAPKAIYRWFPCKADNNTLYIYREETRKESGTSAETSQPIARLTFPRGTTPPHRCISDFFLTGQNVSSEKPEREPAVSDSAPDLVTDFAPDLVGLQIVTMGSRIGEAIYELFREDRYKEYLLLHGLAVELTEVYADIIHRRIEERLGLVSPPVESGEDISIPKENRPPKISTVGTRFSIGYPCCPELNHNRTIAELLNAKDIGVGFTEDEQMVPEFTTSAFISFHPEAHYFSV